jgi:hypothetical protein
MRILFRSLSAVLSALLAAGPLLKAQDANRSGDNDVSELRLHATATNETQLEAGKISQSGLSVEVSDANGAPVKGATVLFRLPADGPSGVFADGSRVAVVYSDNYGRASVRHIQWGTDQGTADVRVTATLGIVHAGTLIQEKLVSKRAADTEAKRKDSGGFPDGVVAPPVTTAPGAATITAAARSVAQPSAKPPERTLSPDRPFPIEPVTPGIVITNKSSTKASSGHSKKWVWIALVGAAAAGGAFAAMGKSGGTAAAAPSSSTAIGNPSISIGHP